ncbi:MAG: hypothetical protein F4018_17440 [Acidobacteria bacterium]|nr:hypothetical protein [Acidobacteriota bacterium]
MNARNGIRHSPKPLRDDGDAGAVRRRQLLLFSVIAAVLLAGLAAWLGAGGGGARAPQGGIEAGIVAPDAAERVWTLRSEARLGGIETKLREMEREARSLRTDNDRLAAKLEADSANAQDTIDAQAAVIDELQRQAEVALDVPAGDRWFEGTAARSAPVGSPDGRAAPLAPQRMIETFELEGGPRSVPADPLAGDRGDPRSGGDIVADASAGVSSQGDPRPVLMRITGPAWTAAEDGVALAVDVDGCTVTGAAHGDLSSEKVYVRFRTMTCAGPEPGTVVETEVAGFVAGSGKTGVRGPVVSREGALVEKAFLAGMVSGLGQGVSQAFQPQAVATGSGAAVANTGLADIGRAGFGAGASSAGQKVSDYMIRRAEQYQPVVQLQAGTKVTLVFLEGARIGGAPRAVGSRGTVRHEP